MDRTVSFRTQYNNNVTKRWIYIYRIKSKDGSLSYIGQRRLPPCYEADFFKADGTIDPYADGYYGSGSAIMAKMKELGLSKFRENFDKEVLLVLEPGEDPKIVNAYETFFIAYEIIQKGRDHVMNRYLFGTFGEEAAEPHTAEHNRNISKGMMGHVVSEVTKRRMSEAKKGRKRTPYEIECMNAAWTRIKAERAEKKRRDAEESEAQHGVGRYAD